MVNSHRSTVDRGTVWRSLARNGPHLGVATKKFFQKCTKQSCCLKGKVWSHPILIWFYSLLPIHCILYFDYNFRKCQVLTTFFSTILHHTVLYVCFLFCVVRSFLCFIVMAIRHIKNPQEVILTLMVSVQSEWKYSCRNVIAAKGQQQKCFYLMLFVNFFGWFKSIY